MPRFSFSEAHDFEAMVGKILTASGFSLQASPPEVFAPDFVGVLNDQKWAIEVKYYRTSRVQPSLVAQAAAQLAAAARVASADKGLLIVSSELEAPVREDIEAKTGVLIADRSDLVFSATKLPDILNRLLVFLGYNPDEAVEFTGRSFETLAAAPVEPKRALKAPPSKGHDLCQTLRQLKPGRETWRDYEKLGAKILKFLFQDDLSGWDQQKSTTDGLNRYDMVCRVSRSTEFWHFVMHDLDSRYVVFEFKNYDEPITQGQVLTTEKYLMEKALRRVAFILTRKGAGKNANAMRQGAMREAGKLMIVLDDDDMCKMLHMKDAGEDPSDYLFCLADQFLLSLPR